MDKPKPKYVIGIRYTRYSPHINSACRSISLEAKTSDILEPLKEFGKLLFYGDEPVGGHLDVSICYDYDEVLEYIKFLGKEKPEKTKKPIRIRWTIYNHEQLVLPKKYKRGIGFYCTDSKIVKQLCSLGKVHTWSQPRPDWAWLDVDPHYAYNEVLQYMEEYPNRRKPKKGSWPFPIKKKVDRRYATGQAAFVCFSCRREDCPFRWLNVMDMNNKEFMPCPFRQRKDA